MKQIGIKILFISILLMLCCFSLVSAKEITFNTSQTVSQLRIAQLKYEPYPVNPGEYFDLWLKVEKTGSDLAKNVIIELMPEYPFSLDANEDATRSYGKITNYPSDDPIVVKYKVRVDEDAVEGINELRLRYTSDEYSTSWLATTFDIEVANAQTDFDIVVQDASDSEVSFAIANIGKNIANSVIIKIPEQDNFRAAGTSGQMLGNLEDGDYTIASFEIIRETRLIGSDSEEKLKLQIDYTDTIGERRTVVKEVSFSSGLSSAPVDVNSIEEMRAKRQAESSIFKNIWFWVLIIAIVIAGVIIYKKYVKKYIKNLSKR